MLDKLIEVALKTGDSDFIRRNDIKHRTEKLDIMVDKFDPESCWLRIVGYPLLRVSGKQADAIFSSAYRDSVFNLVSEAIFVNVQDETLLSIGGEIIRTRPF